MRKVTLKPGTRNEIDSQVEKILRGLGNPEPPLDLDAVFKLQQLDPQYYRTSEDGVVRETISRVKVGAKLFFERPTRIWEAIKTANLKALWIPEQKRILVDGDLHVMKQRWNFAHEIGHSIIDWHRDFTFGDDSLTLVEGYHVDLEAEANYAAGRLLFLRDLAVRDLQRVEEDLDSFGMTRMVPIRGVRDVAACIAHPSGNYAWVAAKQILHSPEATTGKNYSFVGWRHRFSCSFFSNRSRYWPYPSLSNSSTGMNRSEAELMQ